MLLVIMNRSYARLSLGVIEYDSKNHKVLGQAWDNETGELKFDFSKTGERAKNLTPTKRNLLSILASLFHPLEIVSPSIVYAKVLLQDVCTEGVGINIYWERTQEMGDMVQ